MTANAHPRFVAIGNAIVDVQTHVDDGFLTQNGIHKGSMELLDDAGAASLYSKMGSATESSGGSAANTTAGIAALGTPSRFIGMVGEDQLGEIFVHDMRAQGVAFDVVPAQGPTAHCLILISACGQRSMRTHLGVASQIPPEALEPLEMRKVSLLLVEGYLWSDPTSRATVREAMGAARAAGVQIAFGASSVSCIRNHRDDFLRMIEQGMIDILFANEEEVQALSGVSDFERGASDLASKVGLMVATLGPQGSIAYRNGVPTTMPAHPVERVVDTTGAGDMFCAGFLHAWLEAGNVEHALRVASIVAAEAISHHGARPMMDLRELLAEAL